MAKTLTAPQESQESRSTSARPIMGEWPSDIIDSREAEYRGEIRHALERVTRGPEFHRSLMIVEFRAGNAYRSGAASWDEIRNAHKAKDPIPEHILAKINAKVTVGEGLLGIMRSLADADTKRRGLVDSCLTKGNIALLISMGLVKGRDGKYQRGAT